MTDVVAALIWDNDRFLACQRPAHKARGLLWEFVGGKVEPGETPEEALIRECREELDVTVRVGEIFMTLVHAYPDLTVRLFLFNASIVEGTPKLLEHNDARWITTQEIDNYDFCPADEEVLAKLKRIDNGFQARLLSFTDPAYKDFHCKLMPTVSSDQVIGVRMPILRQIAAEIAKTGQSAEFLSALPHKFYEENNIHSILISKIESYSKAISELDNFLPFVDNWATCDLLSPVSFQSRPDGLLKKVRIWMRSNNTYTVRFGISVLMKYYLDAEFTPEQLQWVAELQSNEYYVQMMQAWYFATALSKQYDAAHKVLAEGILPRWVHNKTIQKAVESLRIHPEIKAYLKTLKR